MAWQQSLDKDVDSVFHLASVVGGVKNVFQNEANVFHDTSSVSMGLINSPPLTFSIVGRLSMA